MDRSLVSQIARKGGKAAHTAGTAHECKYNPIERCWATLERYWNSALLDSIGAVVGYASNMTWKGMHPVVQLVC